MEVTKTSEPEPASAPDWILLGAFVALLTLGMMMIYSSTSDWGYRNFADQAHYFTRQLIWVGIGAVTLLVAYWFDYRHWARLSVPIMIVVLSLLVSTGVLTNGRQLIGQSVSPVELVKPAFVIFLACWLSSSSKLLRRLPHGFLPFAIIVAVVSGLVMAQPDISEAVVIVLAALAMLFLAGARLLPFAVVILGSLGAFALAVSQLGPVQERLAPFIECWMHPLSCSNFQLSQGLIGLGSGGLLGLGPFHGRMKYLWLPAGYSDSIFAIIGEELGLVGSLYLIGLYVLVAYRGLNIAVRIPDLFGRLLAAGLTSLIVFQAIINLLVVTGTLPFTGVALPFISLGGSSLVTMMLSVGILLNISRVAQAKGNHTSLSAAFYSFVSVVTNATKRTED